MDKDVTVVAVDLAKDVFQIAGGDGAGRVLRRQRLGSRLAFARELGLWRDVVVVMESCATAHYWGRECQRLGLAVRLLPAQHVKAYRRRNKTDAADESPRDLWRLHHLREWSHEEIYEVFAGAA